MPRVRRGSKRPSRPQISEASVYARWAKRLKLRTILRPKSHHNLLATVHLGAAPVHFRALPDLDVNLTTTCKCTCLSRQSEPSVLAMIASGGPVKITQPRTKPRNAGGIITATPARTRAGANPSQASVQGSAEVASREQHRHRVLSTNDPRLPPRGATLTRIVGTKRLECQVEADGFRYAGKLHSSLSAAASAAARDAGVSASQNGFIFWGLVQPSAARSPEGSVAARWKQYEGALRRALESGKTEAIRREVVSHIAILRELLRVNER